MQEALACPRCRADLLWSGPDAACPDCGARFEAERGVPVLLDRDRLAPHALAQAREHDFAADPELDVERPRGTPALYGTLLAERFERSVHGVHALSAGALVVTVCGGPGMDAELLAAMGCRVIATDVSVGATGRARERARRRGLDVMAVVAAAEHLPLGDGAVDVAYVHDGLHHLEDPMAGLREMARVARSAVVVSEPGAAALTRAAAMLGLAADVEPGGNRIHRLDARDVGRELRRLGFQDVRSHRYAMHYAPEVGLLARGLSRPRLSRPALGALAAVNRVAGRLGNKLVVQGTRHPGARLGSRQGGFAYEAPARSRAVQA